MRAAAVAKGDKYNLFYHFISKPSYMHILAYRWMNRTERYVELFKLLSDETRLKMIVLLHKKELCVCQITAALGISQTNASRHLAILRRAGLLITRRDGLWVYYILKEPEDALLANLFKNLRDSLSAELSSMLDLAEVETCETEDQVLMKSNEPKR